MKKLLILLLIPTMAWAQSVTDFGLPAELDEVKNVVLTSSRVSTIRISSGRVTTSTTRPGFSGYLLNFLHGKIHEDGFEFKGKALDGSFVFEKSPITFTSAGQTYNIDGQTMLVYKDLQGLWYVMMIPQTSSYRLLVNRRWITYTADELAALAGITKTDLWAMDTDYYYGSERNPATHITSVFVKVNQVGAQNFTAQTYVNLQPITSGYGSKITSYGKSGASYVVRWKLYNGCTASNATSGGYEAGNFGLCELRQSSAYTEINPQTFTWDTSREYVVIECQIEELPASGKNFTVSGYFVVQGCDTDDPCGTAQRLPRKPAQ